MMKQNIILTLVFVCLSTYVATAQTRTLDAFKRLAESEYAKQTRALQEMDSTGLTSGRCEIYRFDIPQSQAYLLEDVLTAFDRDSSVAYYQLQENNDDPNHRATTLTYGDEGESVLIGKESDKNYRVICFADNDRENFRYGYVVEWSDTDDGRITGRLISTYGKRPTSKKSFSKRLGDMKDLSELGEIIPEAIKTITVIGKDKLKSLGNLDGLKDLGDYLELLGDDDDAETTQAVTDDVKWLTEFNRYRNAFIRAADRKSSTVSTYATHILKLCKNADKVKLSANEKKLCVKSIKQMRKHTNDAFVQGILDEAINLMK